MKTILLSFLFLLFGLTILAQSHPKNKNYQIRGRLLDSASHAPLEYATVSVFAKGETKPSNGAVADNKGEFKIENLAEGLYKVVLEFIGYKSKTINNVALNKQNPIAKLNTILLVSAATTLQNITVSGQPPIIENKIDKLVFNAERDITSQVGVATDILKKVPQVSVDIDGNVQLAGSSSIRFLIDGKPSAAFGSNISDVLQSIPASQIKSIEVITSPGAKYDAQGLGGIINIILKKNNSQGVNGNLSLTAGTRNENGSFNFNARKRKFGMNAYISGDGRLKSQTTNNSLRITNDTAANSKTFLNQNSFADDQRSGYHAGLGFDWDINEHNGISGSLSYASFGHKSTGITDQVQQTKDQAGNLLSDIQNSINSDHKFHFHNVDASLNYKKTFKKDDQELDLEVNTSQGNRTIRDNIYQYLLPQDSLFYSTKANNPGTENETELRADYTQPFKKKVLLGVGSKLTFYDIKSNSQVLKLSGSENYTTDNYLSDNLGYHQKVYAFYGEITFPVFKLFDAKLGERYERTEINSFYSNAQQQQGVPGYNTFVPSLFFSKKLGENSQIKLSYTKRIERPDYGDLNPFINTSDPKNFSTGNPHLSPEIGKRYELGYNIDVDKIGSFMASLFYRINENDIQDYIVYYPSYQVGDTTYKDVAVNTQANIGRENNFGLNLFASAKFFSKLDVRTNAFFFVRHTINKIDKGYDYSSFNYRINMNADYQFSKTLVAEFFGNFRSAIHQAQGTEPAFASYSLAVRKQFWNKKASIALTASNPFSKYLVLKMKTFGPDFNIDRIRSIPFRSIGLNFTWKFGKLEFKNDKTAPVENLSAPIDNG